MVNVPPGVPGVDGAYVATAELILDGTAHHIDLAPFAPGRLPTLDQAKLRRA